MRFFRPLIAHSTVASVATVALVLCACAVDAPTASPAPSPARARALALPLAPAHASPSAPFTPPVWLETAKLTASDGAASDNLGWSIAISGDTAVIGAPDAAVGGASARGAAYVFLRNGAIWSVQQKLVASDGAASDRLGSAVAISGDTAVLGAPGASAAYVFVRTGAAWSQQQKLTPAAPAASFGSSVAIASDTALVGAPFANANQGEAIVFTRTGTTWVAQQALTASDGAGGDFFGKSVAISGDIAVAGAYAKSVNGAAGQGAAYVFARANGAWTQAPALAAADGAKGDNFGTAVAIDSGVVLVGAPNASVGAHNVQGAAYIFTSSSGVFTQAQKLTASAGAAYDAFGSAVALLGARALVASPAAAQATGAATLFESSGGTFAESKTFTASDAATGDQYGFAVAVGNSTLLAGAAYAAGKAGAGEGAAYVEQLVATSGSTCALDSDCASTHCADGVCCDSACTGQCEACNAPSTLGVCSPVTGAPQGKRAPCVGTGGACAGACDGVNRALCSSYPGPAASCGVGACSNGVATTPRCDGAGHCVATAAAPCDSNLACADATACKVRCVADSDCVAPFVCDAVSGTCGGHATSQCIDDANERAIDGRVIPCGRFKCENGACRADCDSVDDCVAPNVCDGVRQCSRPTAGSNGSSSGCALAYGDGGGVGIGVLGLALAGMAAARRRRLTS